MLLYVQSNLLVQLKAAQQVLKKNTKPGYYGNLQVGAGTNDRYQAGLNLNLKVHGENDHHQVEACFKAVARALRQAIRRDGVELPSTKGVL